MPSLWERTQVHLGLVLLSGLFAGYQTIARVALNDGLGLLVFSVYRNLLSLALLVPVAIVFERKTRPPLTWRLLGKFFMLGILGIVGPPGLFLVAMSFCSAAFAAAFQNIIPVATFIVAVALGIEQVNFHRPDGKAKVGGTLLCMIGALIMSVYEGPAFLNSPYPGLGAHHGWSLWKGAANGQLESLGIGLASWQIGALILILAAFTWGLFLTFQAPIQREYPAPNTIMAFTYLFGTSQFGIIALFVERDISHWKLEWGSAIPSIAYGGIVSSFLGYTLQAWCIKAGGPLLTAVYVPVQSLFGLVLAIITFGDTLYLGSIIGSIGAVMGLYLVTWGRAEAMRLKGAPLLAEVVDAEKTSRLRKRSDDSTAPLLQEVSAT